MRRHGQLAPPIEQDPLKQLVGLAKERRGAAGEGKGKGKGETEEERMIRAQAGKGRAA